MGFRPLPLLSHKERMLWGQGLGTARPNPLRLFRIQARGIPSYLRPFFLDRHLRFPYIPIIPKQALIIPISVSKYS